MKKILQIGLPILLSISGLLWLQPTQADCSKQKRAKTKYCFAQSANEAKLSRKSNDTFTLTLKGVNPYVTYFSERPKRKVGYMSTKGFVKYWKYESPQSFKYDPPNADVSGVQIGKTSNFVLELTNPKYDYKSRTLTYTAKPLGHKITTGTLSHVTLFIDDVCLSCW